MVSALKIDGPAFQIDEQAKIIRSEFKPSPSLGLRNDAMIHDNQILRFIATALRRAQSLVGDRGGVEWRALF
jgi:hypothetical protein